MKWKRRQKAWGLTSPHLTSVAHSRQHFQMHLHLVLLTSHVVQETIVHFGVICYKAANFGSVLKGMLHNFS